MVTVQTSHEDYRMVHESVLALKTYCEKENYKGWDPYDGLNSKIFQSTPIKNSRIARLIWIQFFKRFPLNLRKLFFVPKDYNAKGLGLFLTAYCNLYQLARNGDESLGSQTEILERIIEIANRLLAIKNNNYSGACWGYSFDWQSKAFFLPKNTPTVVATSFVVEALCHAYEITKNPAYLDAAMSSAKFVTHDLNRINKPGGLFMFSYSPLDHQAVYNATLLGTKILSIAYYYTGVEEFKDCAYRSAKAVCDLQNADGSFPHSDQVGQSWRDNFHTGFKLESLLSYQTLCADQSFNENIQRGFKYWLENFFDHDTGFSYYYDRDRSTGLVDLHCAAEAMSVLHKFNSEKISTKLMDKIALWSINNMQSENGNFYFQKNNILTNKISYMRWPNAWMLYGLSYWLLSRSKNG